jgi:hypothetical protein
MSRFGDSIKMKIFPSETFPERKITFRRYFKKLLRFHDEGRVLESVVG